MRLRNSTRDFRTLECDSRAESGCGFIGRIAAWPRPASPRGEPGFPRISHHAFRVFLHHIKLFSIPVTRVTYAAFIPCLQLRHVNPAHL